MRVNTWQLPEWKRTDRNVCPTVAKKSLTNLGRDSRLITMTLRERLEWLSRVTLLVFILAAAAVLSAVTAMRIAIHGGEVAMPNLVVINVAEASQLLQSRGLLLRVADRI